MRIALQYPNKIVNVDKYRYFSGKRYTWFDWTNTKRAANYTIKRIRTSGSSARIIPMADGFAIYVRA